MPSLLAILSLGFALGLRHATDSDHVVAVTTVVSRQRSLRVAGLVGAVWGVGHTLTVLAVGGAIVLFRVVIPPRLGLAMEMAVALMLIALGVANLGGSKRGQATAATHAHSHSDGTEGEHEHGRRLGPLLRSLVVGVVHGLAGSAAVALLVLTVIPDRRWALLYLLVFGSGTVVGMMALTSLIAVPFAMAAGRFARLGRWLAQITSIVSIGLGVLIAYRIGIVDGLLLSAAPHWTPE